MFQSYEHKHMHAVKSYRIPLKAQSTETDATHTYITMKLCPRLKKRP